MNHPDTGIRVCWCAECYLLETTTKHFKRCSRCAVTWYCARHCQQTAWPIHSRICRQLKDAGIIIARVHRLLLTDSCTEETVIEKSKLIKAEKLIKAAIKIFDVNGSTNSPFYVDALGCLAELYVAQGKNAERISILRRSIEVCENILGPDHSLSRHALFVLSMAYLHQRKWKDSEIRAKRLLQSTRKIVGRGNLETAKAMILLAQIYTTQERHDEADPLLLDALITQKKEIGRTADATLETMKSIAQCYKAQSRIRDEEKMRKRILATYKKTRCHPEQICLALNALGQLYEREEKIKKAEMYYQEELALRKKGLHDSCVVPAIISLGRLHASEKKFSEAEPLLLQAVSIYNKQSEAEINKERNLAMAVDFLEIANIFLKMCSGEPAEIERQAKNAKPLAKRALEILLEHYGADDPEVAKAYETFSSIELTLSQHDNAIRARKKVHRIYHTCFGPDHPCTKKAKTVLTILNDNINESQNVQISMRKCSSSTCSSLETPEKPFKMCVHCKAAYYCSIDCQRADYIAEHGRICQDSKGSKTLNNIQEVKKGNNSTFKNRIMI